MTKRVSGGRWNEKNEMNLLHTQESGEVSFQNMQKLSPLWSALSVNESKLTVYLLVLIFSVTPCVFKDLKLASLSRNPPRHSLSRNSVNASQCSHDKLWDRKQLGWFCQLFDITSKALHLYPPSCLESKRQPIMNQLKRKDLKSESQVSIKFGHCSNLSKMPAPSSTRLNAAMRGV